MKMLKLLTKIIKQYKMLTKKAKLKKEKKQNKIINNSKYLCRKGLTKEMHLQTVPK